MTRQSHSHHCACPLLTILSWRTTEHLSQFTHNWAVKRTKLRQNKNHIHKWVSIDNKSAAEQSIRTVHETSEKRIALFRRSGEVKHFDSHTHILAYTISFHVCVSSVLETKRKITRTRRNEHDVAHRSYHIKPSSVWTICRSVVWIACVCERAV